MRISEQCRARAGEWQTQFQQAQPFRHVVIDQFLDAGDCDRLVREFPAFDRKWAVNEAGVVGRKSAIPEISKISAAYKAFDALMQSPELLGWMGRVTGIDGLLYDPKYVGGGTHENLDGQDLDVHVDFNFHPSTSWHRRLNLIVFLNPEWHAEWGGFLELLKDPWDAACDERVSVVPLVNRAVIFETTEVSWHGFRRITLPEHRKDLSRKSLAVYFYTKARPAEATAASHGTVYVPQALPEHLEAGYTLTVEDVHALQVTIERRNAQIRFLYERELEFAQAITDLRESLSFRAGRVLTGPLRWVRDFGKGE